MAVARALAAWAFLGSLGLGATIGCEADGRFMAAGHPIYNRNLRELKLQPGIIWCHWVLQNAKDSCFECSVDKLLR